METNEAAEVCCQKGTDLSDEDLKLACDDQPNENPLRHLNGDGVDDIQKDVNFSSWVLKYKVDVNHKKFDASNVVVFNDITKDEWDSTELSPNED